MRKWIAIIAVLMSLTAVSAGADSKAEDKPAPPPSAEDMHVIALLEILQMMDLAQEMDMVNEIDYLIEDHQNENE